MKESHFFLPPILESTQSKTNREYLEKSQELFNEEKYIEAIHSLLDYLNPEIRRKFGNQDGTVFNIPHGSILVKIRIENGRFSVMADFLRIPEKGRIAMLRQIAELNNRSLMLARFKKEDDRLLMTYECNLEQTHPHKLFHLFQNICIVGDKYDDELCHKFGATRCYEPQVTPYAAEDAAKVYEGLCRIATECSARIDEYTAKRDFSMAWNMMMLALYQISYFAAPQGQFLNELDSLIDGMDDNEKTSEQEIAEGKAFLDKIKSMPREEIIADLYYIETFTPTKRRSSLRNVQENFLSIFQEATECIQNENYERAVVRILFQFYAAYYYNNMQDDINAVIVNALSKASGKTWEEAAEPLYEAMDNIMEGELDNTTPQDIMTQMGVDMQGIMQNVGESLQGVMDNMAQAQQQSLDIQTAMSEALARGDMQEYMRLVQEYQQKMMQQMLYRKVKWDFEWKFRYKKDITKTK